MNNIKFCTELHGTTNIPLNTPMTPERYNLLIIHPKRWDNGATIRVRFLDGSSAIQEKVEQYAHIWEQYANIKFLFTPDQDAEIRISFKETGSWSYLGTDCKTITDKDKPTMNFGWFNEQTPDHEFSRTVLHEFGHALGFGHEHLHPKIVIPWNREKVYQYYMNPPNNWSKEMVDRNIFEKYSKTNTNFSEFDSKSIMLYAIPNDLTDGDYEVGWNTELSDTDKKYAAIFYPKTKKLVTLQTHNGQYICAENGGGRELVANRENASTWETFELIDLGNNRIALKAHKGHYVCAEGGGGQEVVANRERLDIWETFELIKLDNNKIALKAHNGQYVCAEGGGGREIVANRDQLDIWETFNISVSEQQNEHDIK